MDVMEQGRLLIAADVAGAVFGVWQGRKHTGIEVANVPGAFTWSEHMSRDFEGAKAFYAAVFGYEYGDMSSDGFSYATMLINGQQVVGGIGAFPAGQGDDHPAGWSVYFGTSDTDKAVEHRDRQRRPGDPPRRRQPLRPDGRRRRRRRRGLQPHLHPGRRRVTRAPRPKIKITPIARTVPGPTRSGHGSSARAAMPARASAGTPCRRTACGRCGPRRT